MKPGSFDYLRAASLAEVFAGFDQHGDDAMILAGGQNVMAALNMRLNTPALLIDINQIPGLDQIEERGDVLRIGALCRHEQVRRSPVVQRVAPMLAAALEHVAHPAIRNRGTFGGSICNADAAAELPACALAQNAMFNLESAQGSRTVPASEFFLGYFETVLEQAEILTSVDIPLRGNGSVFFFDEITRRQGDYALAGLAALAVVGNGQLNDIRFAFFSCGDRPLLAPKTTDVIAKFFPKLPEEGQISEALIEDLSPLSDAVTSAEARLHLAKVLTLRAAQHLSEGVHA